MPKLDADRAYVNRVVNDATASLVGLPANSLLGNPTAGSAAASTLTVAAGRIVGRGSTGNLTQLTPGNGIAIAGTTIQLAGVSVTRFVSSEQTITAGGSLSIAHGLAGTPQLCFVHLVCKSAELNYSVDQRYYGGLLSTNVANAGCGVSADGTNITVRFGSAANTFVIHNNSTGATAGITNANWRAVFTAIYWA